MATVAPPPSKRQRREALERSQLQQDVTPPVIEAGSFKARFVDNDGNQLAETIEVPLADATEKNVSLLLNTLLGRVWYYLQFYGAKNAGELNSDYLIGT